MYSLMTTELFGPVLSVYARKDGEFEKSLSLTDSTTKFALTGRSFRLGSSLPSRLQTDAHELVEPMTRQQAPISWLHKCHLGMALWLPQQLTDSADLPILRTLDPQVVSSLRGRTNLKHPHQVARRLVTSIDTILRVPQMLLGSILTVLSCAKCEGFLMGIKGGTTCLDAVGARLPHR